MGRRAIRIGEKIANVGDFGKACESLTDDPCSTCCHGPYADDLVRRIKSAKVVGEPMTADEFMKWLRKIV